jgi:hypothetical protein
VTMLVRSDLTTTSPTEVLREILTRDIFKKSQAEAISLAKKVKGESIALKAKAYEAIEKEESEDEGNGQTSRRNAFSDRKCFECGEPGHIAMNCPSKKSKGKDGDDKKKKFYHKKKDGKAYLVEWDSDASSDDDDDDSVAEPPELFQLKCISPALEARPHLNRNNTSVPRI